LRLLRDQKNGSENKNGNHPKPFHRINAPPHEFKQTRKNIMPSVQPSALSIQPGEVMVLSQKILRLNLRSSGAECQLPIAVFD
jgi:hypothetical protein